MMFMNPYRFGSGADPDFSMRSLLMHMEGGSFVDSSSYAHTITATGATQDTGWSYFGTKSALIATSSSSTNKITIPDHAAFDFGSGEFTIAFALRIATLPGTQMCVLLKAAGTGAYPFQIIITSGSNLVFRGFDTLGNNFTRTSATTLATNTDYWVQCRRRNGTTGSFMEIGINGVQDDTSPGSTVYPLGRAMFQNTGAVVIGNYNSGSIQPLQGRIDELVITKGKAEAFAVPTSAFSDS